jgi:hypothetical protein
MMRLVLSLLNAAALAIAWCLALILGAAALLLVITVMSIAYSISNWAGLGFLGFVILVVWMMFYAVKD